MSRAPSTQSGPGIGPRIMILVMRAGRRLGLGKHLARAMIAQLLSRKLRERAFAGYQPTRADVFVATFSKSGTNWMMQIAVQIAHRGAAEFEHIHDVVPWPDAPPGGASFMVQLADATPREQSPTDLRIIKTHLETDYVPYAEAATYLTVIRDPKEVLVSSYYFLCGMLGLLEHVSIDDWFDLFMAPGSMAEAWAEHTAGFWAWRDRPNVLVLSYREIGEAPRAAVERVADVLGVALTEAELERVLERSSFEYMKAHQSQFAPPKMPFMNEEERPLMIRRGVSGRSDEKLTRAQQVAVDRICRAALRSRGCDFPYEDAFDVAEETA